MTDCSSDDVFADHFSRLPPRELTLPETNVYIPVPDDPISSDEVFTQIKKMDPTKAPGHDGLPARALRYLAPNWVALVTHFMNLVFYFGYPIRWTITKMFTIHKRGPRDDPGNYRGISIMVAMSKLYDSILNKRLTTWYQPDIEQVGAVEGRSCAENLLTLCLVLDTDLEKSYILLSLIMRKRMTESTGQFCYNCSMVMDAVISSCQLYIIVQLKLRI